MSRRSRRGTASLRCGLTHEHEDGPPGVRGHRRFENVHRQAGVKSRDASSYLDKSGAARLALVRLFSRVDAGVGLEIGRSVKLGAADVAVVRLRTCGRDQKAALSESGSGRSASDCCSNRNLTCVNSLVAG